MDKVYEHSDDLHVRNTYLYIGEELPALFYDRENLKPVRLEDVKDLFIKGCLIVDTNVIYSPIAFGTDDIGAYLNYIKIDETTSDPVIISIYAHAPILDPPVIP